MRAVLMWYIGALVLVGGSGAAGFTALKQHRAQLATQVATVATPQVMEEPAPAAAPAPVAAAAVRAPTVVSPPHHPAPAAQP